MSYRVAGNQVHPEWLVVLAWPGGEGLLELFGP
jgi:hypothetical protein